MSNGSGFSATNLASRYGWAWVALCGAIALHVTDEATTGFLAVYNPTVIELRTRYSWFPMPVFEFRQWLTGLICAVAVGFLLSPLFFSGLPWTRPIAYFMAITMTANGLGHTLGTIMGRSVETVHFARPMPGFYSSPFLIIASVYLFRATRALAKSKSLG